MHGSLLVWAHQIGMTYLNEKAKPLVQPVADAVGTRLLFPLDVEVEGAMETVFAAVLEHWGRVDVVVHSHRILP